MSGAGSGPARGACLVLALVAAGLWLAVTLNGGAAAPWLLAKVAAMPLLAGFVALSRSPGGGLVAAALVVQGAGDLLLELAFLAGVAAFLLGHLLYLGAFWPRRNALDEIAGGTKLAVGALALLAAGFLAILAPRLRGAQAIAIPLYVAALAAMVAAAWWVGRGRPWVPIGASLFLLSDALLGLELFAGGAPGGRALIWPLYVGGQVAIAAGWTRPVEAPGDRGADGPRRVGPE